MLFPHFFINRTRFAFVISIIITLAGLLSLPFLPVELYPKITPPQITVTAIYPGADADTIEKTVAQVIEGEVNGVDNMMYMSSSSNDGSYSLSITFNIGTDEDMASVDVQNRISLATPSLPQEVINNGVSVKKRSSSILAVYILTSPKETYDQLYLSNYASINILDQLSRLDGVGGVDIFGERKYAMRIWMNPEKLTKLNLTYQDVIAAIQEQNIQAAAGQIGKPPVSNDQQFQYTVRVDGRLSSPEEFKKIVIKADSDGNILTIGDIAKVELGSESYDSFSKFNQKVSVAYAVYQKTDSNALDVIQNVDAEMARIAKDFPEDITFKKAFDATKFISVSLTELTYTLLIALVLVILVVYVFLQDWRTTIIPTITIPVSLIGTLAAFQATGFSINMITLFGLVLAIGTVVDDAIVVVENTQRKIDEGMNPVEATRESMSEVTSPVIATTLVLLAVFVPVIFMPGIEGRLYQQFAMTIAISVSISSLNALTLSPALCALILRKTEHPERKFFIFRWFDKMLSAQTSAFVAVTNALIRKTSIGVIIFFISIGSMFYMFKVMPSGFVPDEDQGAIFVNVQLPDGASLNRTDDVMQEAELKMSKIAGIENIIAIRGFSIISGQGTNKGLIILKLAHWDQRKHWSKSVGYILGQIYGEVATDPGAQIIAFPLPAIMGLGTTGGFELALQNKMSVSNEEFAKHLGNVLMAANQNPKLKNVYTTFTAKVPQIKLDVDRTRAKMLGVSVADVFTTLQAYMGSINVNDFNIFGKSYNVTIMADSEFRDEESDIAKFFVRNNKGQMVPLSALVKSHKILGQESVNRYNMFRYANINGSTADNVSSGEAMAEMEKVLAETLPTSIGYEWTGASLQEKESTSIAKILIISLIFVYLFLVAQYESSMMPISVLMVMPIAAIGGMGMAILGNTDLDIYAQIGMLVLAGLSSKQAILIVEFAKVLFEEGYSLKDAAIEAMKLRFRAVMMTALSFILGILPLLFATGAGAGARVSLGTIVFGGMTLSVILGTIMIPVYFYIIEKIRTNKKYPLEGTKNLVKSNVSGETKNENK